MNKDKISSSQVIDMFPKSPQDNPDEALKRAMGQFESVIVIGWDNDQMYRAELSTNLTKAEANLLIDIFKNSIIQGFEVEDN